MVHGSSDRAAAVSVGTGRCCAAGRGGCWQAHVARGQFDGGGGEGALYSTLWRLGLARFFCKVFSNVLRVSFCKVVSNVAREPHNANGFVKDERAHIVST